MAIPEESNLQLFLLMNLVEGDLSGSALRLALAAEGHVQSQPAFYQAMGRMERAGLVVGRYEVAWSPTGTCRERFYRLTPEGLAAIHGAIAFWARFLP